MTPAPPVRATSSSWRVRSLLLLARADMALCAMPGEEAFLTETPGYLVRRRELVARLRHVGEALIHAGGLAQMNAEVSTLRPALLSPLVRRVAKAARACEGMVHLKQCSAVARLAHDVLAEVSAGTSLASGVMRAPGTHGGLGAVLGATVEAALALRQLLRAETRRRACHAAAQSPRSLLA